jgi:hypothetical protein
MISAATHIGITLAKDEGLKTRRQGEVTLPYACVAYTLTGWRIISAATLFTITKYGGDGASLALI